MNSEGIYRRGIIVGSTIGIGSFVVIVSTNSILWMIPYIVAAVWLITVCEPTKETKRG